MGNLYLESSYKTIRRLLYASPPIFQSHEFVLQNGTVFQGFAPDWQQGNYYGEVVFTTGMTGYPESLTDPSYAGQILAFTYPLIGNYGIPAKEHWESAKIHAKGVVVSEACRDWSHHKGIQSLLEWLKAQNVPLITGVDTRALTKMLRASGTMMGVITGETKISAKFDDPNEEHLVAGVSHPEKISYRNGKKIVFAVDCGMKENIVEGLCAACRSLFTECLITMIIPKKTMMASSFLMARAILYGVSRRSKYSKKRCLSQNRSSASASGRS